MDNDSPPAATPQDGAPDEAARRSTATAAQIGALAAQFGRGYDSVQWKQGGYQADDWDSGPNYVPNRARATPAPRGRTLTAAILAAVMTALVVVGTMGLWRTFKDKTTAMDLGTCVSLSKSGDQWTTARAECESADQVTYTIVSRVNGQASCPDPYSPFLYRAEDGTVTRTYCLMENLVQGSCYAPDANNQVSRVACDDPRARVKVATRVDGYADANRCSTGEQAVMFGNSPQRTYCFTESTS